MVDINFQNESNNVVSLRIQLIDKPILTFKEGEDDPLATTSMFGAHLDASYLSQVVSHFFL